MFILSTKKYNALIRKIEYIEAVMERVNIVMNNRHLPEKEITLAVHNNGHKGGGKLSATDAVLSLMRDGKARSNLTIMREVNESGRCRRKIGKNTVGSTLSQLAINKKLERMGRGIYRIAA